LNADLLRDLRPDVILTQALCEVCAVPTSMVEDAVCTMPESARIVSMDPVSLDDVSSSIVAAGEVLGVASRARALAAELRAQIDAIRSAVDGAARPRMLAAEWLEPVYCGGHWVPEMIEIAGGTDAFGAPGERSHPLTWDSVLAADPKVIVLMPCGFFAPQVVERYHEIAKAEEWQRLRAVRECSVYAVDATSYYSRPGPRLVEGARILARIMHPDRVTSPLAPQSAYRLTPGGEFVEFR
jgi:iron complex transport system substrate-binding protein